MHEVYAEFHNFDQMVVIASVNRWTVCLWGTCCKMFVEKRQSQEMSETIENTFYLRFLIDGLYRVKFHSSNSKLGC